MKSNSMLTFLVLAVLGVLILVACRGKKNSTQNKSNGIEILENDFSKSKDTVWFHEEVIADVDPETFVVLDDYYVKDKRAVYYYKSYRLSQDYFTTRRQLVEIIKDADPVTFIALGDGYGRDATQAFYQGFLFNVSDVSSLSVLNLHFVKDKNHAYADRKPIEGSIGKSFELLSDGYAKDESSYYLITPGMSGGIDIKKISCHYETFSILDYNYSKDHKNVFFQGLVISGADPSSFEILENGYARDKKDVYFKLKAIPEADPVTFSLYKENENLLGDKYYAKDKHNVYVNGTIFLNADLLTFTILNDKYCKDKNGIYYGTKKVKNADINSFKVFPHDMGDADAEDKNHRYGKGKVVE